MPKITVIIPTFNRDKYLAECLDSILSQTVPVHQIIVVNDGSTDNTYNILQPYMDKIQYIYTEQLGRPDAINKGLEIVSGDYLWIFDDDDVALPDALERFVEPLEKDSRYGFSYSTFFYANSLPNSDRIGPKTGESIIPDIAERGFLPPLLESNFLGGAALFARTICYQRIGKFDYTLFRSQDYEMAIRIARNFKGFKVEGKATFYYRQHNGIRGPKIDQFDSGLKKIKWLHYDQIFFRRIYNELPLSEYLPPSLILKEHFRQALLQRIAVSITKALMPEAIYDLYQLSSANGDTVFSEREREIIQTIVIYLLYSNKIDYFPFLSEIRRIAITSKLTLSLRTALIRGIIADLLKEPNLVRFRKSIQYCKVLYGVFRQA